MVWCAEARAVTTTSFAAVPLQERRIEMAMTDVVLTSAGTRSAEEVAVVGSGASGLAAAFRLQQAGYRVRVFEVNDRVGGRMRTIYREGFLIEEGPTQMVRNYKRILGIISDAGMSDELIPASSQLGMLDADGTTHNFEVEHIHRDMAKTKLITWPNKLTLSKVIVEVLRHRRQIDVEDLSKLSEIDHLSAEQYGRQVWGDEVFDAFVDPVVRGFVGTTPANVSASCMLNVFATFMSAQKFIALRGGMASYAEAISRRFDVTLNAEVLEVRERSSEVDLTWRDIAGVEHNEAFAGVVIATQPKPAAQIHAGLAPARREFLASQVKSAPIVAVHVAMGTIPASTASMVYSTEQSEQTRVLAVSLEHNKVSGRLPAGKGVATIYASTDWSRDLLEEDDDHVRSKLLAAGEALVPGVGRDVLFTEITRWPHAWFQSYPGYWTAMREFRREGAQSDRLVQIGGEYFCTSSLNVASAAGERAARALIGARSQTRAS
jgi:oxygen-dependent protoporphyrinogen oxidase